MQLAIFGDMWQRRQYQPQGLGFVPSWQFSADPGVNIKLNPNVKFPPGWTQRTVQPVSPQINGLRDAGIFDSWAWTNRKWLVFGGVGMLGAAVLAGAVAVLR